MPKTCDVMLHAGDMLMTNRMYSQSKSIKKLKDIGRFFGKISDSVPLSAVIGGNHDYIMPILGQEEVSRLFFPARFLVDQFLLIPFDDPSSAQLIDPETVADTVDPSLLSRSLLLFASPFSIGKSKNRAFQMPRGSPLIDSFLSSLPRGLSLFLLFLFLAIGDQKRVERDRKVDSQRRNG